MKAAQIIIRKQHEDGKMREISLRELWKNGFHVGQSIQEDNKHFLQERGDYVEKNGLYATDKCLKRLDAFWFNLDDAEVIINES